MAKELFKSYLLTVPKVIYYTIIYKIIFFLCPYALKCIVLCMSHGEPYHSSPDSHSIPFFPTLQSQCLFLNSLAQKPYNYSEYFYHSKKPTNYGFSQVHRLCVWLFDEIKFIKLPYSVSLILPISSVTAKNASATAGSKCVPVSSLIIEYAFSSGMALL